MMVTRLSKKLISNTSYLTLDWIFATVFSLAYWIIIGKFFPRQEYGIISTVNGLVSFVSMLSMLGLSLALMKLIPEYMVHQKNKVRPLIKHSFKIVTITNIVLIILFLVFSDNLTLILKIDTNALILSLIGIISMSFFSMSGSVIYGLQNMKKYFTSDIFGQFAKVAVTLLTVYTGFLFYGPMIGLIAGFLASLLLRFDIRWLGGSGSFDKKVLFKYSAPALISILLTSVFTYYQYIVLPIVQNQDVAGLFAVALRVTMLLSMIPAILISGLFPILSQLSAVKNSRRLQGDLLGIVSRYALFIIVPMTVFVIIYARPLVSLFSQSAYLPAASLFPILAISSVIYGLGNIYSQALYALKKPELYRNIAIVSLITFLVTSVTFAYFYSSFGLSIAYLVSSLVLFIPSVLMLHRNVSFNMKLSSIWKIFVSAVAFSLVLSVSLGSSSILKIIDVIFAFITYVTILIFIRFFNQQDVKLLRYLSRKLPVAKRAIDLLISSISV